MKQRRYALDVAKHMPPLRHTVGETFDIATSEVVQWLVAQGQVRQYLFRTCNKAGLIVYDQGSETWHGKDYKPITPAERFDAL